MTKLGSIEFDSRILDAIRDEKLVVFAGAGVSMGAPSCLSSFWKLTSDIARGTGLEPTEPLDRFLGQLIHRKIAVHDRAAQLLSPTNSAPNALHHDLLRLFRTADRIKLVTTNFDLHFETAASTLFGAIADVYRAPALPLGYDFTGIVHVHGALPRAKDLVLTDADFGRAYLTEGWARQFLVDVFRSFTVLFVGYSHNDVVMNYLARALPADGMAGRFALTETEENWDLLGITPIRFNKGIGVDAYKELNEGVQRLAERATRGVLDWQSRLVEIGNRAPPTDEEAIGEVEQALREVYTTRFFINIARDPEWLRWLNARKYLDALFGAPELDERDKLLAEWLAKYFAIEHALVVFEILAVHDMQLGPELWLAIGRELGLSKDKSLLDSSLNRWINILLASAPAQTGRHVLMWLAERCTGQGCPDNTLKVFLAMSKHRLKIKFGLVWHSSESNDPGQRLDAESVLHADHWSLNKVWIEHLRPHLGQIAQQSLSGVTRQLEEIHHDLRAWDKASQDWDPVSYGRSAIEPHEQNRHPKAVDVLIDAARDALEWLAANAPALLEAWTEKLVTSDVPLMRRLAIHAITVHPGKSADERIKWLLDRVGLHNLSEHHEVHRAVALSYVIASDVTRHAVVNTIQAQTLPVSDSWSAEERTARLHFDWLSWLLKAKSDCIFAGMALVPINAQYPAWLPSDQPDLTHWAGSVNWIGSQSPWSVEELLAKEPREQLADLLGFKGSHLDGPDRDGLLMTLREACKQSYDWAFALTEVLVEQSLWSSDLWSGVIRGLQESELTVDVWRKLLATVSRPELHAENAYDVAQLLYSLVKNDGKPFCLEILEQANAVALLLWQGLEPGDQNEDTDDWLSRAINQPAGMIVEFWINGLSLLMRGKSGDERILPEDYRCWFTMVAQEPANKGGQGRTILASQTAFLFGLDEGWTSTHIVPLFSDSDDQRFAQAWDGFLVWGRLYPALVEVLMPAFIQAPQRLAAHTSDWRRRFVEFYTSLAVFHVSDATQQLLPAFFKNGSLEDRASFASYLSHFLRQMQPAAIQQLWDEWLYQYWQDRLQGVLAALDESEVREMLGWILHLGDAFPAAVSLAIRAPTIRVEHSDLLFELRESELVLRYPAETAELLIYLCSCELGYNIVDLREVDARLSNLSIELRKRLDEALALVGIIPLRS
jgi:hypothetical protein